MMDENNFTRAAGAGGPEPDSKIFRAVLHIESRMGRSVADEKVHLRFGNQMIVGREKSCELCLPDDRISRKHALLRIDPDAARFTDLGSTNGSARNDLPVKEEIILETGDRLELGHAFTFEIKIVERDEKITSVRLTNGKDVYLLIPQDFIIGFADPKSRDVDLKIYDPEILPKHARLEFFAGHIFIASLDPQKQVMVNSRPVMEMEIKNNHLIEIGQTLMRFEAVH